MSILSRISDYFRRGKATRNFDAGVSNRLTADWIVAPLSADAAIAGGRLNTIRNRTRDLERNNEWVRGFLRMLENNVLGEKGIGLHMRIKDPTGKPDLLANDMVLSAFIQWAKTGNCTLDRRSSWRDVQRIVLRTIARDGEVLVRRVRTKLGLRLQVIEPDLLDQDYSGLSPDGNEIRFGVEFDSDRAVVAYWLLGSHPGDLMYYKQPTYQRIRIPENEIYHLFIPDRVDQTRGFPWLIASMKGLRMLDGYAEAELVAARTAASKMGFFTKKTPDGYAGYTGKNGDLSMNASPGAIEELPEGVEFKDWNPTHPNSAYNDFVKGRLRGVATSLGISYNTLASDLENVNFSSIRAGLLEERELWKALQRWLIEHFCELVFTDWLELELLRGALPLPFAKMWKFNMPEFHGRRWSWVDPEKDVNANILAVRAGFTSQRRVIAEQAGDIEDVFEDQQADQALAKSKGLVFVELTDPAKPGPPPLVKPTAG